MKSRNSYELDLMRKGGIISAKALKRTIDSISIGISELELDNIAKEEILRLGGDLSYKSVPNYKYATCITVNDEVVHGVPTERKIQLGDIVSIDLAVEYKGWHTDCAWSVLVGKDDEKKKFLEVGEQALLDGIAQAYEGKRVGDISNAIQTKIESAGYNVVRSLVGHGIGRSLHEEPQIPCFGERGAGPILLSGATIAIEVIFAKGSSELSLQSDGWTFKTADRSWGGLFEMTVIVGKREAEVLTDWRFV